MTITASRIVAGTTREDDLDIVIELDARVDYLIAHCPTDRHRRIDNAAAAFRAAFDAYHTKWVLEDESYSTYLRNHR